MKKSIYIKNFCKYAVISLLSGLAFLSCGGSSGLGPEVDLSAPVVKLTSHEDNDTVPSCFTLQGTATDNEGVTNLTIDFDDANIHYKIVPGGKWKKKTAATNGIWTELTAGEGSCVSSNKKWNWSVYVNTAEASSSWTDNTYELKIVAEDAIGNTGKNSNLTCALTVDTANPDVSVYKPDLFNGAFSGIESETQNYALNDGNVISRLLNGDITFAGRQENSISFKELRIEFDNGGLASGTAKVTGDVAVSGTSADAVAEAVNLGDEEEVRTYYSKTLRTGQDGITDLRNWTYTLNASEWVNDSINSDLKTGKHLIRMVTTSVSDSQAWQKKVIGYFIWWPEADTPWISTYIGDDEDKSDKAYAVYPSANYSGTAQDDDGIAKLSYVIQKKNGSSWDNYKEGELPLSEKGATYTPWTVQAPSENGNYKISLSIIDINGSQNSITKYFRILDVKPPKIEIASPATGSSVLSDASGNITFVGTVTDDGSIKSFEIVYLNPAKERDAENNIKYLSGTDSDFDNATESGYEDSNGNFVYKVSLGSPSFDSDKKLYSYTFSKTFNLFSDLKIDGETRLLSKQNFVFRAVDDGGSNSVLSFAVTGDTEPPVLKIETLQLKDSKNNIVKVEGLDTYTFKKDSAGNYEVPYVKAGCKAVLTGKWSDNSTTSWGDSSKIKTFEISWVDTVFNENNVTRNSDGSWTASIDAVPSSSGAICITMIDYAGNVTKENRSIQISGADPKLVSVGANNDDGSYNAGKTITLTLDFTKNVKCMSKDASKPLKLKLNNGCYATYSGTSSGSDAAAQHLFTYTVSQNDENVTKLNVTGFENLDSSEWTDPETQSTFTPVLPSAQLDSTRTITIDTKSPGISKVSAISAGGDYGAGSLLVFKMEFDENVSISDTTGLSLKFNNRKTTTSAVATSSSVLFTYEVTVTGSDDHSHDVATLALDSLSGDKSKITDEAGNELSSLSLPSTVLDKSICIDTQAPNPPTFRSAHGASTTWTPASVIFDSEGTQFGLGGDTGASFEYTLKYTTVEDSSWVPYKGETIKIPNNGTYKVAARQTDKAGNTSEPAVTNEFTIDKGGLLTRITAETVNGTYSTKSTTKKIEGKIEFRSAVKIPANATVTLNVKRENKNPFTVDLDADGTSKSIYKFEYDIEEGDSIDTTDVEATDPKYGLLDVTAWSFDKVTYLGKEVSMTIPAAGEGKRFNENREIKIVTGKPKVGSVKINSDNSILEITFDRPISKVGGDITITQDSTSYRVPAVLSASKYSDLESQWSGTNGLSKYYKPGTNGAKLNGTNLSNDTETKYILDYSYNIENTTNIDNTTLKNKFIELKEHIVTIPIVSSSVAAVNDTLRITLGSTYALPTKGVSYTVSIPAGAVVDSCQNPNDADSTKTFTSNGVETPTIRVQKSDYTINNAGSTANATVTLPEIAKMKIECRTPNSHIKYSTNPKESAQKSIKNVTYNDTKTDAATVSSTFTAYSSEVTLGTRNNTTNTLTYDTLTGLKIAIAAYAYVGNTDTEANRSEKSYEYATRTVLKFRISGNGGKNGYDNGQGNKDVTVSDGDCNMHDLQIWVQGGDAPSGTNSISTFPLSWGKEKYKDADNVEKEKFNYKLMKSYTNNNNNPWQGTWAWVTWDLSAPAYHGFVAGDVPSDAQANGPKNCFVGECGWNSFKDNYVLYPGETLEMCLTDDTDLSDKSGYFFRQKNKLTRN